MRTSTQILTAAGLSMVALLPAVASAHTDLSIGVNLGGYAPIYQAPAPVYYAPPVPVASYYPPAPTVVYGAVTYGRPYWDGHRWCRGEGYREQAWRRHEWREHHPGWRR